MNVESVIFVWTRRGRSVLQNAVFRDSVNVLLAETLLRLVKKRIWYIIRNHILKHLHLLKIKQKTLVSYMQYYSDYRKYSFTCISIRTYNIPGNKAGEFCTFKSIQDDCIAFIYIVQAVYTGLMLTKCGSFLMIQIFVTRECIYIAEKLLTEGKMSFVQLFFSKCRGEMKIII